MPTAAHPQQHNSQNCPGDNRSAYPVRLPLRGRRDLNKTQGCVDENYGPSLVRVAFENRATQCLSQVAQNLRIVDASREPNLSKRLARHALRQSRPWRVITGAAARNARKV